MNQLCHFYASATKHLGIGMLVGWFRHKFQKSSHTHARRRETSYDVARLLLMVHRDPGEILPHFLVQQPSVRPKMMILGHLRRWALWRHGRLIHQRGGPWERTSSEGLKVGTLPSYKMHNVGTVPTFKMHNVGTVPTYKMHNVGTVPTYNSMEDHQRPEGDLR